MWTTPRGSIVNDVRRLEQGRLAKAAHRAPRRVRTQDRGSEAVLVEPEHGLARRIAAHVRIGNEAGISDIGERERSLELDEAAQAVD